MSATGTVQYWNFTARFGFISPTISGPDIHCRADDVEISVKDFRQGIVVKFDVQVVDGKKEARHVRKMKVWSDRK